MVPTMVPNSNGPYWSLTVPVGLGRLPAEPLNPYLHNTRPYERLLVSIASSWGGLSEILEERTRVSSP